MIYIAVQAISVSRRETPDSTSSHPPEDLVVGFWTLVLLFKLAILAIGIGVLVLIFTDVILLGGALLAVGLVVLLRWILTYRKIREKHDIA